MRCAMRPTDEGLLPGKNKRAVGGEGCGVQWAVGISLGPRTDPGVAFPPVQQLMCPPREFHESRSPESEGPQAFAGSIAQDPVAFSRAWLVASACLNIEHGPVLAVLRSAEDPSCIVRRRSSQSGCNGHKGFEIRTGSCRRGLLKYALFAPTSLVALRMRGEIPMSFISFR